jgi:hypothetical protein
MEEILHDLSVLAAKSTEHLEGGQFILRDTLTDENCLDFCQIGAIRHVSHVVSEAMSAQTGGWRFSSAARHEL